MLLYGILVLFATGQFVQSVENNQTVSQTILSNIFFTKDVFSIQKCAR